MYQLIISSWHSDRDSIWKIYGPKGTKKFVDQIFLAWKSERELRISYEKRKSKKSKFQNEIGSLHHVAFWVSQSTIRIAEKNLSENGFANTGIKDRGFMDSIYFRDPLGLLIELASYKFDPPFGYSHANVLEMAHKLRIKRGALNIEDVDVSLAIRKLSQS